MKYFYLKSIIAYQFFDEYRFSFLDKKKNDFLGSVRTHVQWFLFLSHKNYKMVYQLDLFYKKTIELL